MKMSSPNPGRFSYSILKEFQPDDSADSFSELRRTANNHIGDIYRLNWGRFEELTQNIFKNTGYRIVLARESIDGSSDTILLSNDREFCIAQCEKHFAEEKITIKSTGKLIGVMVDWKQSAASLVTSVTDKSDSVNYSGRTSINNSQLFELSDISKLLDLLECRGETIPKLADLSDDARQEIINQTSKRYLGNHPPARENTTNRKPGNRQSSVAI